MRSTHREMGLYLPENSVAMRSDLRNDAYEGLPRTLSVEPAASIVERQKFLT